MTSSSAKQRLWSRKGDRVAWTRVLRRGGLEETLEGTEVEQVEEVEEMKDLPLHQSGWSETRMREEDRDKVATLMTWRA